MLVRRRTWCPDQDRLRVLEPPPSLAPAAGFAVVSLGSIAGLPEKFPAACSIAQPTASKRQTDPSLGLSIQIPLTCCACCRSSWEPCASRAAACPVPSILWIAYVGTMVMISSVDRGLAAEMVILIVLTGSGKAGYSHCVEDNIILFIF